MNIKGKMGREKTYNYLVIFILIILLSTNVFAATTYINSSIGNNISIGNSLFIDNSNNRVIFGSGNNGFQILGVTNTSYLTIASATAASCDLKAHQNGTVYCGTDSGGSADGTGGWSNTSTYTTTTTMVNISNTTGSPLFFVNTSNNQIGVNIYPSRGFKLEVEGNVYVDDGIQAGNVDTYRLDFVGDYGTGIQNPSSDVFAIFTNSLEKLRVDSSGRVGIGTTTPGTALQVNGSINVSGSIITPPNISIGLDALGYGTSSTAIGNLAQANFSGIALGSSANSTSNYGIAIGSASKVRGIYGISIGFFSNAESANTTAVGHFARANQTGATVIGDSAYSTSLNGISIGAEAASTNNYSIAIGFQSSANFNNSAAFGRGATAANNNQFAVGSSTNNLNTMIFGNINVTSGKDICINGGNCLSSVSGGSADGTGGWSNTSAYTTTTYNVNITGTTTLTNLNVTRAIATPSNISIGSGAMSNASGSIAIGHGAKANAGDGTVIVIGQDATTGTDGRNSIVIGKEATTTSTFATSIGYQASSLNYAIALGSGANAVNFATALGAESDATNTPSLAIGYGAQATGFAAIALGTETIASQAYSISIGYGINNSNAYTLQIGNASQGYNGTIHGNFNSTGILSGRFLRISNTTAASCDLKADTNGNVYCGTDATGAAAGDGTGGWINTTTQTETKLPTKIHLQNNNDNNLVGFIELYHNTTNQMTSGFGTGIFFKAIDANIDDSNVASINAMYDGEDASGALSFVTFNLNSGFERMRIDSQGRVGIGTTTPANTLSINGTTNTTYLTIASATAASCDLKAHQNGTVYCGTDAGASGGNLSGGGANNYLAKFNASGAVVQSSITDDGQNVTVGSGAVSLNFSNISNVIYLGTDAAYTAFGFTKSVNISGNLSPSLNNTFSLGSPDNVWRNLYLGNSSLHIGGQTISATSQGLEISGRIRNEVLNVTYLTIASATAGSCDLKAYDNGTVYCGTDATGVGGSGDGTGGWNNYSNTIITNQTDSVVKITGALCLNAEDGTHIAPCRQRWSDQENQRKFMSVQMDPFLVSGAETGEYGHWGWTSAVLGTGTDITDSDAPTVDALGTISLGSGTLATSSARLSTGTGGLWLNGSSGITGWFTRVYLDNAGRDAQNYTLYIGMSDGTLNVMGVDAIIAMYNSSESQYWQFATCSNSVCTKNISTHQVNATKWYDIEAQVYNNTLAVLYINGINEVNLTNNIPSGSTRAFPAGRLQINKTAGTTERRMYVDYYGVYRVFDAPRW